jgi:hypothetical protein
VVFLSGVTTHPVNDGEPGATPIGYDDRGSGPATVLRHPFFSRTI